MAGMQQPVLILPHGQQMPRSSPTSGLQSTSVPLHAFIERDLTQKRLSEQQPALEGAPRAWLVAHGLLVWAALAESHSSEPHLIYSQHQYDLRNSNSKLTPSGDSWSRITICDDPLVSPTSLTIIMTAFLRTLAPACWFRRVSLGECSCYIEEGSCCVQLVVVFVSPYSPLSFAPMCRRERGRPTGLNRCIYCTGCCRIWSISRCTY